MRAPLGELVERLDDERFVGREALLELVADALSGTTEARIVHIHGAAGVGKSALLRALARVAQSSGRAVRRFDGRDLPADVDGLALTFDEIPEAALVLVDEIDAAAAPPAAIRDALRSSVPADAVVVLAGRRRRDRDWFDTGLEHLSVERRLEPLDDADAHRLLQRRGVPASRRTRIVDRSHGFPIALAAACDGPVEGTATDRAESVLTRLGRHDLDGIDPSILEAAAVAPAVDRRILAAALPGHPTRGALADLRSVSCVEVVDGRLALHPLVRQGIRDRLVQIDPGRYRILVTRIATHLAARAATEDSRLVLELAELVEDHGVRLGWRPSRTFRAGRLRRTDPDALLAGPVPVHAPTSILDRLRRWISEEPSSVLVVRRTTGEPVSIAVANRGDHLPSWVEDDVDLGPMVVHARAHGRLERSSFLHKLVVSDALSATELGEVIRVGNSAVIAHGLSGNPRWGYVTDVERRAVDGTDRFGYRAVPELARTDGAVDLLTMVADFGPGGVVGALHAMIRAEQGDATPPARNGPALVAALRCFHDDAALGALGLVEDGFADDARRDLATRAAAARAVVRQAVDAAFGPGDDDRFLHRLLIRTYLDPDGGHGRARQEMHLSRSSLYRHLARARERVGTG